MKKMRKVLSVLIGLSMMASTFSLTAYAVDELTGTADTPAIVETVEKQETESTDITSPPLGDHNNLALPDPGQQENVVGAEEGQPSEAPDVKDSNIQDVNNGVEPAAEGLEETEKTPFALLKEAIEQANVSNEAATVEVDGIIEVTETLTISGEVTLTGGTLLRAGGMAGALVNVTGTLTLADVTLDGNRENVNAKAPLVTVKPDASLTVDDGAVLENNSNISGSLYGGAINNMGTLTMQGGTIQNNYARESGGGVYNIGGQFIMTGGEITQNVSERATSNIRIDSTGGGVCVATGSMEMSGGTISYNSALGIVPFGGGIALGDTYDSHRGATLTMTGGTIEGNTSSGCGGGIAVWSYHEATITGGDIINNHSNVDNPNYWNYSYYGGGGIYINKYGKLTLKNVEVANNEANLGGGLAACPTSDVHLYIKNGGVFYDNMVTLDPSIDQGAPELFVGNSKDILIVGGKNNVPVSITSYTMNGYKYNWTNANGELASASELNGILNGSLLLNSGLTTAQGQRAGSLCSLHITGNTSGGDKERSYGGGIGCNGTLIIGEDTTNMVLEKKVDGTVAAQDNAFNFTLTFKVDEETAYTGSVTLLQDGNSSMVKPNEAGELRLTLLADEYIVLTGLPVGVSYAITEGKNLADKVTITHTSTTGLEKLEPDVNTEEIEGSEIEGNITTGTLNEILYTNIYNTEYTSLTVNKLWAGDAEANRPASVTVQLYDNGEASGEPVTLDAATGFTYTWTGLDATHTWTVREVNVPEGYTSSQVTEGTVTTITNTFIPRGSLVINKVVTGISSEAYDKTYTFNVTGPNGYTNRVSITGSGSVTLFDLVSGTYTVTEEDATIANYVLTVTGEGSVTVSEDNGAQITITNDYEPPYRPEEPKEPDEPDEEIPEEPTPLTPPDETVPEDDIPLAPPAEEEIPEEDIPLVDAPKTGSSARCILPIAVLALGACWFLYTGKKSKKDNL